MRRLIIPIFFLILTFALVIALNTRFGFIPPIGKLLDPFKGAMQNSEMGFTPIDQENLQGLDASVTVKYDSMMIPHIFAQSDKDLYYAQGYITAKHRLWQMEFQTHFAAGRLSEVFGDNPQILALDRKNRRIGLTFGAQNSLKKLMDDPVTKSNIEAYAAGVNAYIDQLADKDLPVEYKIFDYKPEPWTPFKTSLLLKYMANDLAGHDYDLPSTNSRSVMNDSIYQFLYPIREFGTVPVINRQGEWNFESAQALTTNSNQQAPLVGEAPAQPDPDNGSNNWVISGEKSYSGNPILAGDPHLGLNLPSLWFVMQLNAPGVNAMGGTLPGAMDVIIGFNEDIAWTETNSRRDVKDWYKINFADENKTTYKFGDEIMPVKKTIEIIKIRGKEDFYDTVMYTHHGPIVYDDSYPQSEGLIDHALRWMAHDESNESKAFYMLNRAGNFDEYRAAISNFDCPAQNFAFGCRDGDIALTVQGKFPIKSFGQGQFLMDGADPDNEWKGFIPFEENAFEKNPARGFVASANQFPVDSTYPYFVYDGNYEHYRNRRIINKLTDMDSITIQDMIDLQNDNYNLIAAESLPTMLNLLEKEVLTDNQRSYLKILEEWNYMNDPDLAGPAVYQEWWDEFYRFYWDEMYNDSIYFRRPSIANTIHILKNYPDNEFTDNKETDEIENMTDILMSSFISAVETLKIWQDDHSEELIWANYKSVVINHLIPTMAAFSAKDIYIGGGSHIVNATKKSHGPSWKLVVELGTKVKAWGVYPGGQSGNPGSKYYNNFIDTWSDGKLYPLLFLENIDQENPSVTHVINLSN